jgi:hypothetical protein
MLLYSQNSFSKWESIYSFFPQVALVGGVGSIFETAKWFVFIVSSVGN